MRIFGISVTIAGLILLIIGIAQTTIIHAFNMTHATEGIMKNDTFSILVGICGCIIIIVGIVFIAKPKKKSS